MPNYDLKYVAYDLMRHNNYISQVAYIILGDKCIFTAADKLGRSTINCAEGIATNICKATNKELTELRWFDLQTNHGYTVEPVYQLGTSGDFEFDEVKFRADGWAESWEATICPQHVIDMFSFWFIPGKPRQIFNRGRKNAQRVEFKP